MGLRSIMSCLERFPMVFSISLKNIVTPCVFIAMWILLSTRSTLGCVRLQTDANEPGLSAIEVLNEAGQIAVSQDLQHSLELDRVILEIADLQIKGKDFEGAKNTIQHSGYLYGANAAYVNLAEALARTGDRERAFEVLKELGTDHGWNQDFLEDGVRMFWIESLLAADEIESAQVAISKLVAPQSRPEALSKLALTHARRGDKTMANRLLLDAFAASARISDEHYQSITIGKVARTSHEFVDSKTASSLIQQLRQLAKSAKGGLAKVGYLREAAVLAAKVDDDSASETLFKKAIESRHAIQPPEPCPEANRIVSLNKIAKAQASVGFFGQALETAAIIMSGSQRNDALREIAIAQAKAGNQAGGIVTALSIKNNTQYKDDALVEIANLYLEKGDNQSALTTARKISNPSVRAAAILRVATQYVKDGDEETAKGVAGEIQLTTDPTLFFPGDGDRVSFNFAKAETWGVVFGETPYFTMSSHFLSNERAAELAAAAIAFHCSLAEPEDSDFAVAFQELDQAVVRSLAHAHAKNGDPGKAHVWAIRIGSAEKIESEDFDAQQRVVRRLNALIGVAEGLLAKQTQTNQRQ